MRRGLALGVFFLAASLSGCCCCIDLGSQGGAGAPAPRPPPPPELLGEWRDPSQTGPRTLDLYDPRSGTWLRGQAPDDAQAGTGLRFTPDGRYVWGSYVTVDNDGCRSWALDYQAGKMSVEGSSLFLYPSVHRQKFAGDCGSLQRERDVPLEPQLAIWDVRLLDDGRRQLRLQAYGRVWLYVNP